MILHMPGGSPGAVERPGRHDLEVSCPRVVVDFGDGRQPQTDPCIVDEHVEPTELGDRVIDEGIDFSAHGHIAGQTDCAAALVERCEVFDRGASSASGGGTW